MITMNARRARAAGYRALTGRYCLPEERWMLNSVLTDMRRGRICCVLVKEREGVSVWRRAGSRTETPHRRGARRWVTQWA